MPTINTDSISFPGSDGEPIIVPREEFRTEMHALLGESKLSTEGSEQPSPGSNSSRSQQAKRNSSGNSGKSTTNR